MYDKEIVINVLNNIKWSIETILKRSDKIDNYEDFLKDDTGREKLDSICMQLINIGEALKEIDKISSNELLNHYPEIDWKAAKGMRDILTHHYFDVDAEIIFDTINDKLPALKETINKIISNLNTSRDYK
jgi:uncharacterized protein with HEPN domain